MEYLNILFLNSISSLIIILNGIAFKKLLGFKHYKENLLESGLYGLILISLFPSYKFSSKLSFTCLLILLFPTIFIVKNITL